MAGDEVGESSAKVAPVVTVHSTKIDVAKFDGVINFGMWMCEMRDALNAQNLEETLESEAAPQGVEETTWKKMNRSACGVIRSCLTQDIKYLVMNEVSAKALWDTLGNKYLTKTAESRLHLKRRLYAFRMRRGASIGEHLNNFTKLLADLLNVEVKVEDEDKAMILMNSLPEEYEVWCDSFISGKVERGLIVWFLS